MIKELQHVILSNTIFFSRKNVIIPIVHVRQTVAGRQTTWNVSTHGSSLQIACWNNAGMQITILSISQLLTRNASRTLRAHVSFTVKQDVILFLTYCGVISASTLLHFILANKWKVSSSFVPNVCLGNRYPLTCL